MRQEGYHHLVGDTGYLLLKLPQEIMDDLKLVVDEIQKDFTKSTSYSDRLAGQIDKEFHTKITHKTNQYVKWAVDQYTKHNPEYLNEYYKLFLNNKLSLIAGVDNWVNFQEKYEYNPIHNHSGVFSYVMWYQIPFYKVDEIKYGAGKGKKTGLNQNGEFEFIHYNGESIKSTSLNIDKSMEGYMAVFPSKLSHTVYPFYTSDDYRITISGNVHLRGQ